MENKISKEEYSKKLLNAIEKKNKNKKAIVNKNFSTSTC